MSSLQPGGKKRQTRLQHQGGVQLWNGKPHEDKALGRSCSGGDFNLSLGIAQNFTASPSDNLKKALLKVVREHLTPPPSSTNVERLFSYGGLVATDHRSSLSAEKLDQILFLRENALMANFDLGWL